MSKETAIWCLGLLVFGLAFIACGREANETAVSAPMALTASHEEAEAWAEKTLASLSLQDKAGQMICEQIRG
ncbi:MAG: hypothetical protein JXE07_00965, partial [Candidatus Aminicenantes bacterium]|nr:hypothetical protein [Candidatus Aminicenantes bacterium]